MIWYMYMYIAPGQGHFDVNRRAVSLYPFVVSLKEIYLKPDFVQFFFHDLDVYSPGERGIQLPGGQSFDVNRNLSLRSSVASFKS